MPTLQFIDFKKVKAAITMEQVLEHYSILDKFKRSGESLSGPCPIHDGVNPTQFRVNTVKNVWNCFSRCKGGNALDFIAKMEKVSIHAAAANAIEWFGLDPEQMSGKNESAEETGAKETDEPQVEKPVTRKSAIQTNGATNKPLGFVLEKLDREHPYLLERGLTLETIIDFGVGFCAKGILKDRIAIPIFSPEGKVVAYAGRFPGEPDEGTPKYKLPPGFRKSLELFNLNRARKERNDLPLIIVEGFFDCMKIHQFGYKKVVALMGSSMSEAQEELIRKNTDCESRIILMLDEDEAGQTAGEDIAYRLAQFCYVKVIAFDTPGMQPEHLSQDQFNILIGGFYEPV
jgi:DNA primase